MGISVEDYVSAELTHEQVAELVGDGELDIDQVLGKHLFDGRVFMRRNASSVMRQLGEINDIFANLVPIACKDNDQTVRLNSIAALGLLKLDVGFSVPALYRGLCDLDESVRVQSRESLDRVAEQSGADLYPLLVVGLGDPRPQVQGVAEELMLLQNAEGGPQLVAGLKSSHLDVVNGSHKTLLKMGGDASTALIDGLKDPDIRVRVSQILSRLERVSDEEHETLVALSDDDDADLAKVAAQLAAYLPHSDSPPPPDPIEVDGFFDSFLAAEALEKIAPDLDQTSLMAALRDGREPARANAAASLGIQLEGNDPSETEAAQWALAALVKDPAVEVRKSAIVALGALGGPSAVEPLISACKDGDTATAELAQNTVIALGAAAVAGFLAISKKDHPESREWVLRGLVAGGEAAVEALQAALADDPHPLSRRTAAAAIGAMGEAGKAGAETLASALQDAIEDVRLASAIGLGMVGDDSEAVLEALRIALNDTVLAVRIEAGTAIKRLTGTYEEPISALVPVPVEIDGFYDGILDEDAITAASGADVTVEALIAALSDGRPAARGNAAALLGGLGDDAKGDEKTSILNALSVAAKDPEISVRRMAVLSVVRIGTPDSVDTLASAVQESDSEISNAARVALSGLGPDAAPALLDASRSQDPGTRVALIDALVAGGKDVVDALVTALTTSVHVGVRRAAVTALAALGADAAGAVEALIGGLRDDDDDIRADAATALGLAGDDAEAVLEALSKVRSGGTLALRREASIALERLRGTWVDPDASHEPEPFEVAGFETEILSAEVLDGGAGIEAARLEQALKDGRAIVRHNAAVALGTMAKKGAPAAEALAIAGRDSDVQVRVGALSALASLGKSIVEISVPALARALADGDPVVREAAQLGLADLKNESLPGLISALDNEGAEKTVVPVLIELHGAKAVDSLIKALTHPTSVRTQVAAAIALGRIGTDAAGAREALVNAKSDRNDGVKLAARIAVDGVDGVVPAPKVLDEMPLPSDDFAAEAMDAAALKKSAKDMDMAQLKTALFDGRDFVRTNAARTIGTLTKAKAADLLPYLLIALKDGEQIVRAAAADAFAALKSDPDTAVPALADTLWRADDDTQDAVLEALEAYGKNAIPPLLAQLHRRPEKLVPTIGMVAKRMSKQIVKPLAEKLLPSESIVVRENAADIIGMMGKAAKPIVPQLLDALDEKDILFRCKTIRTIGKVAERETKVVDRLIEIGDGDTRPGVKLAVKDALLWLG